MSAAAVCVVGLTLNLFSSMNSSLSFRLSAAMTSIAARCLRRNCALSAGRGGAAAAAGAVAGGMAVEQLWAG